MSRRLSFRFDLLRNGGFYARLRALVGTDPHIRVQADGQIKMAFTGRFFPYAEDVDGRPLPINWLTDEIQPWIMIDGAASPLGVYIPTTPSEFAVNANYGYIDIEAYDRNQRMLETKTENLLYWPRGTLYLDAVEQLLSAAGITTVFKTPSAAALTEAREDWPIGTPFLDIANELLGEINYQSLRFDLSGNAVLAPATEPDSTRILHTLSDADPDTRVIPGLTRGVDTFNAPNVFVAVCANPDKSDNMRAEAVNDNPQSPLSVQRRGRRIVQVTNLNNIASQAELQAYVDRQRNDSLVGAEQLSVSTGLQPDWGVGDVVALHYGNLHSVCVSKGYDMELKVGGRMTHQLERVVYNIE